MPLPQQVVNKLTQEPVTTPGWSAGVLMFSASILAVMVLIYFGITLIYSPYLSSQTAATQGKINTLAQSISSGDEAQLAAFYSQTSNLRTLLGNHITFSRFLGWLSANTEANIYYSNFSYSLGGQIDVMGGAPNESDINQQIAVFQSSPEVKSVTVSNVSFSPASGAGAVAVPAGWRFSAILVMNPDIFSSSLSGIATSTAASATPAPAGP